MNLVVNDEAYTHRGAGALPDLLSELGAPARHVAVVLNGEVVRRDRFAETHLNENDHVEIIAFAGGG